MKVTLPKNYKQQFTIENLEQAKKVIALCKQDTTPIQDYAKNAINEIIAHGNTGASWLHAIYHVSAEVVLNKRYTHCWDQFGDDTGYMDVELEIVAETADGFIKAWCSMIDIWQIDGETDLADNWYYQYFRRD